MVFIFFFFKQKTAYEMRISDWSSDVCSSDLDDRKPSGPAQCVGFPARRPGAAQKRNTAGPQKGPAGPGRAGYRAGRSEERRVGKEWVSTCRYRGWPAPSKKNINKCDMNKDRTK